MAEHGYPRALLLLLIFFGLMPLTLSAYPAAHGYVNDFAQVLDGRAQGALEDVFTQLDQKAKAQVAVAVVKNLEGKDIESYATGLFQNWGIGKNGQNHGALILVSIEDRRARIEVGYGLEGILPDGLCGQIMDTQMIPYFKAGDYSEGIVRGAMTVASIVAKDAGVKLTVSSELSQSRPAHPRGALLLQFIIFLVFAILFVRHPILFLMFFSGGRGGGFGGGGFGGGFGGFGGGLSGGGGSSRSW